MIILCKSMIINTWPNSFEPLTSSDLVIVIKLPPDIRERAIVTIRYLTEDNKENQEYYSTLKPIKSLKHPIHNYISH